METAIVKIEEHNALEVFTGEKLDDYLKAIEDSVLNFVGDIESPSGRKQIASKAYEVAQEKVRIDNIGKALVGDWKKKASLVDSSRKKSREFLDELKEKVRKPLSDWEKAEEERKQAEREAAELELAMEEAYQMNDLFDREREIQRKEAELQRQEDERKAKEQAEREEKERVERETRIAQEAKEKAEREAQEAIETEKKAKFEAELKAKQDAERAEQEKKEALERAEQEKQEAIAKAQRDEQERQEKIKREADEKTRIEKEKADKKAANVAHQRKINREAVDCFVENGIPAEAAKNIITLIATGKIKNITVNY